VELVQRSVKLFGAGFGVDGKQDSGIAPVLGGEVVALNLELADRVHAELGVLAVIGTDVGIDRAVQEEVVTAAAHSVYVERVRVVKGEAEIVGIVRNDAGEGAHQRLKVAAIKAGLGHQFRVDDVGMVGGGNFNQGSLRFYGHVFRGATH